jgi:hypothetical protein
MSAIGTQLRNSRFARMLRSTGAVAVVLGATAFLLWGFSGAVTLLDMIVALCT